MNRFFVSSIYGLWAMMVMGLFWMYYPDIREKLLMIDPTWLMFWALYFIGFIGYSVYTIQHTKDKEISLKLTPWILLLLGFLGVPILFFISYSHIFGFFSSSYAALGYSGNDALVQIAKRFGDVSVSELQAGKIFLSFWVLYVQALLALAILYAALRGFGVLFSTLTKELTKSAEIFVQSMLGAAVLIMLLFVAAYMGQFWFYVVGGIFITGVVLYGSFVFSQDMRCVLRSYVLRFTPVGFVVSVGCVAALYLAYSVSFLHVLRPMPIGWDDITLYMNIPSLIAQYGSLVPGYNTYNWGLVMASGFTLFGSAPFAMLYSFAGSVLMAWGVAIVLQTYQREEISSGMSSLFTTVFVLAPFVQFQTAEDMKVDLALTAFGVAVMLLLLHWWKQDRQGWSHLGLIGVLLGVMLGIKFTSLLFPFLVILLFAWKRGGHLLLWSVVSAFAAFLFYANTIRYGSIVLTEAQRSLTAAVLFAMSMCFSLWHVLKEKTWNFFKEMAILLAGAAVCFVPWMLYQGSTICTESTSCPRPSFDQMLTGKAQTPYLVSQGATVPNTNMSGAFLREAFSKDIAFDGGDSQEYFRKLLGVFQSEGKGEIEELQRYRGFDKGWLSYISLPIAITFGLNEHGDYITIGWIFLAFFPFLLLPLKKEEEASHTQGYYLGHVLLSALMGLLILAVTQGWNAPLQEKILGGLARDPWAIFGSTVAVFTLVGVLARLYQRILTFEGVLLLATILYWFAWSYIASGVIWYGILGFLPILMLLAHRFSHMLLTEEREGILLAILCIGAFWIVPMSFYKLSSNEVQVPLLQNISEDIVRGCDAISKSQEEVERYIVFLQQSIRSPKEQEAIASTCVQWKTGKGTKAALETLARTMGSQVSFKTYMMPDGFTFMLFKAGLLTTDQEALKQMNPPYADAIGVVRASSVEEKIYRVGTFIPYYTPFNDKRLIHDNQLDTFVSYYLPHLDKKAFVDVLRKSKVGYIVYDNRTDTIDRTPKGTLKKKVQLFLDFLYNNPDLELMVGEGSDVDAVRVYRVKKE